MTTKFIRNYLLLLLVLTISVSVKAQQLEVIAASGEYFDKPSCSLSWTLGEVVSETLNKDDINLTQGFQQSNLAVTATSELQTAGIELSVYPNPTNSDLTIEVKIYKQIDLYIKIFDLNGNMILHKLITGSKQTIYMQNYKPAIYILKVIKGNEEIRTYQIVKH